MTKIYDLATRAVTKLPLNNTSKSRKFINPKEYFSSGIDFYRQDGEKAAELLTIITQNRNANIYNPQRRNIIDSLKYMLGKETIRSEEFNQFALPLIDTEARTNRGKKIFNKEVKMFINGYNNLVLQMTKTAEKLLYTAEERGSNKLAENIYEYFMRESLAIQLEKTPPSQFQDRLEKFFCKYDNDANKREAYKNIIRETEKMGESISIKA